ncbi:MAG: cytochrome b/b6 domain-containing protein [Pacificibacter sp.]|jgi:cytochrome b561|uniref:cytochrome b n=1 Tax=Pacificibacter sp. TaxID=1917866 RepID=UPI00321934EA
MTVSPQAYHPAQKILHWVVVLGILAQWSLNEPIVRVIEAMQTGGTPVDGDMTMALVHVSIGSAIFLSVLARLVLRMRHGVPDHALGTPEMQAQIATWMHRALYATLIAMVITGGMTWNGVAPLGDLHFYFNILLFALALAHAAAALFNQFVRKDGTLRRMM